ncbi:winged helix-turn-helix domain-containing protein [Mesorhizobium sp. M0983]
MAYSHALEWVKDLPEARYHAVASHELVLLANDLPDGNGIDYLREMRKRSDLTPVMIVAARHQLSDCVEGLNAGAAGYLVKPHLDPRELSARIHAVARNRGQFPNSYNDSRLSINSAERRLVVDGREKRLADREWAVLDRLIIRAGLETVSKRKIEDVLSSLGSEVESNAVEVYISRLRKKIGQNRIETVRGVGYKFVVESPIAPDPDVDLVQFVRLNVDHFLKKPWFAGRLILDVDGCPTLMRKSYKTQWAWLVLKPLLENALTHGLRDTPITVSVRADETIAIVNAGPVVLLPDLEAIRGRGRRGATLTAGSGQGLLTAKYAIKKIGGSLEFASPAPGREDGFAAIIRIPR